MAIFTPDPSKRFHLLTLSPGSRPELARTTDDMGEGLLMFDEARRWGVDHLMLWDAHAKAPIAKQIMGAQNRLSLWRAANICSIKFEKS